MARRAQPFQTGGKTAYLRRRPHFYENRDRRHFLELLGAAVERLAWRLHAYVLRPNHYHLLVELTGFFRLYSG